jgi:hypothetical protein
LPASYQKNSRQHLTWVLTIQADVVFEGSSTGLSFSEPYGSKCGLPFRFGIKNGLVEQNSIISTIFRCLQRQRLLSLAIFSAIMTKEAACKKDGSLQSFNVHLFLGKIPMVSTKCRLWLMLDVHDEDSYLDHHYHNHCPKNLDCECGWQLTMALRWCRCGHFIG